MTKWLGVMVLSLGLIGMADAADSVTGGGWAGRWASDKNGHSGPMHARVTETPAGDYRIAFRGRFFAVVPFRYSATLSPVGTGPNSEVYLAGEKRLGFGLGTFSTSAIVTPSTFDASFQSKRDSGRFTLRR
jgi:hypothetical protein